jgi:modulator of FtsH protease
MGYEVEGWHDLFVASAGAAAALAGLVFVAISINVERILQYDNLPSRALRTVMLLILVVIVSVFALVPQSREALGVEVLLAGAVFGIALTWSAVRHPAPPEFRQGPKVLGYAIEVACTVPFALAGASLLAETGGGLYWALAGIIFAIIGAVLNAWVLMVEILR